MKKLFLLTVAFFVLVGAFAQYGAGTVTINLNDNHTRKVRIDGKTYTAADTYGSSQNAIVISDLPAGRHTLKVIDNRRRRYGNSYGSSIVFNTRSGYDVTLNINDRDISLNESAIANANSGYAYRTPMSAADFNDLYYSIKSKTTSRATRSALNDALSAPGNYFTSYQASQLIQLVNSDNNRLQYAKMIYSHITDPYNFNQVTALLRKQSSRDDLTAYINSSGSLSSSGNYAARDYAPMAATDFDALYASVQSKWFQAQKMSQLREIFNNSNNRFSTYQAKLLIQTVSDESNRLELAKAAYDHITDPADFSQMYNVLDTPADRDNLAAYVQAYSSYNDSGNSSSEYNVYARPMENADFNSMYSNIANQWFPGSKMSMLRDAFNKNGNYFTTYQAKRLIQLVSDESNRLELAKLSYRTITDREHFTQMYDLLNNQTDIDRLAEYVKTYR